MLRGVLLGVIAGAAGNLTLEIVTYGDMLLRGRAASGVPAKMAGILADDFGIEALSSAATGEPGGQPPQRRRRAARVCIGGRARRRLRSRASGPGADGDAAGWCRGWTSRR